MNKVRVTVTIDQDVNEKVKELSQKEQRSFSQQVNKILKDYLSNKESQ